MPRYYFDSRDGNSFICDEDGLEFPDLETARDQATAALADLVKDVLPGSVRRELAIEVRDEHKEALLRTSLFSRLSGCAKERSWLGLVKAACCALRR